MTHFKGNGINLPTLDIPRRNFASACVCAGNRIFAVYQVDTSAPPFWVGEMDPATGTFKPDEMFKYTTYPDALACVMNLCGRYAFDDTRAVYRSKVAA